MKSPGSGPDCRRCSPGISDRVPYQTSLYLTATFECNYADLISRPRAPGGNRAVVTRPPVARARERFINMEKTGARTAGKISRLHKNYQASATNGVKPAAFPLQGFRTSNDRVDSVNQSLLDAGKIQTE